jgi:hypothetical protein
MFPSHIHTFPVGNTLTQSDVEAIRAAHGDPESCPDCKPTGYTQPDDSAIIGIAIGRAVARSIAVTAADALADPDTCDALIDAITYTRVTESYTLA